ncbi:hypothetical protein FACS1894152_4560 [Bacilli bacterium]|nr:hypothetical protein FACS1894152_4560 [Bacilli bacterium]
MNKVKGYKKLFAGFAVVVVATVLGLSSVYWMQLSRSKAIKEKILGGKTHFYSVQNAEISSKVSLFKMETNVKNLDILFTNTKKKEKYNLIFKELVVKNSLFSKRFFVRIIGNIDINNKNSNLISVDLTGDSINFIPNKHSFIPEYADIKIKKINVKQLKAKESEVTHVMSGFSIDVDSDYAKSYANTTTRININAIDTRKNDKNFESNFEIVFSNIRNLDANGRVINVETEIETILYNDITNNYGLNLTGNYNINASGRVGKIDVELKLINSYSLTVALNKPTSDFIFFDRRSISEALQILSLVPPNPKDTENDKYYKFSADPGGKVTKLNGVNANDITRNLLFVNDGKNK